MPTTLPERCAPSHEEENSFKSLASVTLLLPIFAVFLSILVALSAANQPFAYPIVEQIYFP